MGARARAPEQLEQVVEAPRSPEGPPEALASALLCSIYGVALPCQVWLALPDRPSGACRFAACVTLPLVAASDEWVRATGFNFDVFEQGALLVPLDPGLAAAAAGADDELLHPLPQYTLQQLQRCCSLITQQTPVGG